MLSKDQIKHMVSRFLSWRLPDSFTPDGGISFKRDYNENTPWPSKHEPVGTNLFDAAQAEAMVRHMLEGLPRSAPNVAPREAGQAAFYECEGNTMASLKAAFDAYEAADACVTAAMVAALKEAEGELYQVPPVDAEQERVLAVVRAAISKAKEG